MTWVVAPNHQRWAKLSLKNCRKLQGPATGARCVIALEEGENSPVLVNGSKQYQEFLTAKKTSREARDTPLCIPAFFWFANELLSVIFLC